MKNGYCGKMLGGKNVATVEKCPGENKWLEKCLGEEYQMGKWEMGKNVVWARKTRYKKVDMHQAVSRIQQKRPIYKYCMYLSSILGQYLYFIL